VEESCGDIPGSPFLRADRLMASTSVLKNTAIDLGIQHGLFYSVPVNHLHGPPLAVISVFLSSSTNDFWHDFFVSSPVLLSPMSVCLGM
jgi:hypothetical protein